MKILGIGALVIILMTVVMCLAFFKAASKDRKLRESMIKQKAANQFKAG